LYVPVRNGRVGHTPRFFRHRDGDRCAVAFSSAEQLRRLLGPTQQFVRLSEDAVRALAEPLGAGLVVDPLLISRPVTPEPPDPNAVPRTVGDVGALLAAALTTTPGAPPARPPGTGWSHRAG
jgi:hypothetical protein